MKKKILVIIYNIERAREHEWYIELLDRNLYEFEFAIINLHNSFLVNYLKSKSLKVHLLSYSGKKDLLSLTWKLYRLMVNNKYRIVHAHLFEATLTGMIAAFFAGIKNRVITRHYSDYHHVYFPSVVKYDRLINRLATKIIAVSENVKNILITREGVNPSKVVLIHHGIDLNEFTNENISDERVSAIRLKYNIPDNKPVIGVVSRFIYWKGLQYILPAFNKIKESFPGAVLVLANAQGPYKEQVLEILKSIDKASYRLVHFETDVPALFKTFTCFVHTPVSETAEAFGQTYIEALAAGVPSVFTKSGVAAEFAENGVNCLVVPFRDEDAVVKAVKSILLKEVAVDEIISNGERFVQENFDMKKKYAAISSVYAKM